MFKWLYSMVCFAPDDGGGSGPAGAGGDAGVTPARPTQVVTQVLPTQVEVSLGRLQRRLKRPHLKVKMFACRHSVLRGPLMGCQNT